MRCRTRGLVGIGDGQWLSGTLEQLNGEQLRKVKHANLQHLASRSVDEISANVIYAVADKPLADSAGYTSIG